MHKDKVPTALRNLDWTKFQSSMPTEGVVHHSDDKKADAIKRMREAFEKAGVRQVA